MYMARKIALVQLLVFSLATNTAFAACVFPPGVEPPPAPPTPPLGVRPLDPMSLASTLTICELSNLSLCTGAYFEKNDIDAREIGCEIAKSGRMKEAKKYVLDTLAIRGRSDLGDPIGEEPGNLVPGLAFLLTLDNDRKGVRAVEKVEVAVRMQEYLALATDGNCVFPKTLATSLSDWKAGKDQVILQEHLDAVKRLSDGKSGTR